ncbi:hypothetical protein L596_026731 [Steinernema carpocapsae]|uniref:DUF5641 domain-containing protein n=1 Tax=Steinernema carpocapsae TaxID=34508 RepID=A0A4U5M299_STECR|nr:hypothetical protein L596_026731 [Steinernema carpocapsae]
MSEVAALMNQRPLTYLDSEDDGFSAIRPCDFYLKGRNLTCALKVGLPRTTMDEWMTPQELQAIRTRQEALEALDLGAKVREHIWKQFSLQYIAALREHHRAHLAQGRTQNKVAKVGMVAILDEAPQPRYSWKLVRIIRTIPNKKGQIGEVEVRLPDRTTRIRSVTKLIPLELEDVEEEGAAMEIPVPPLGDDSDTPEQDPPADNTQDDVEEDPNPGEDDDEAQADESDPSTADEEEVTEAQRAEEDILDADEASESDHPSTSRAATTTSTVKDPGRKRGKTTTMKSPRIPQKKPNAQMTPPEMRTIIDTEMPSFSDPNHLEESQQTSAGPHPTLRQSGRMILRPIAPKNYDDAKKGKWRRS